TLQINPVRQALVQDLAVMEIKKSGVQARIDALNGIMTRMERDIADVAKDQMQYVRLMRDVKALEIVYTSLLTELSQAKVAEAREPNGFTVLDWATPEKRHIKPRAKLTIAAGLLLGFIFGSLVAILLESKHPTKRRTV
ncbi:MAG TPA: GNVR domain-containing protein, partial [Armatimonadota bacterium]|nr:GNVR domain-containing protein [Armatimonadota bacterium]